MRRKKPKEVSLDEVRITRKGDSVEYEYADDEIGRMTLVLGVDVSQMSDHELVERHNEVVREMDSADGQFEYVAIEVPAGSPQIEYHRRADQWAPRGSVLRCLVNDAGTDGEATIEIDGRQLSLREFGRLLTAYSGWGMRIAFVPGEELDRSPTIEVREPDDVAPPAAVREDATPERGTRTERRPAPQRRAAAAGPIEAVSARMPVYRLRITLLHVTPPIWRTVLVSGNVSLRKVHHVIQAAMGWTNSHPHLFRSPDRPGVVSDPRFELDSASDEARIKLRSFARDVGARFFYDYDFGDGWEHEIVVEEIGSPRGRTPRCVDGARACPPEDCGGPLGYVELLAALADRSHPRHAELRDWVGGVFDPESFDVRDANLTLRDLE